LRASAREEEAERAVIAAVLAIIGFQLLMICMIIREMRKI
jgi:hypothetical protein